MQTEPPKPAETLAIDSTPSFRNLRIVAVVLAMLVVALAAFVSWRAWTEERDTAIRNMATAAELESRAVNAYLKHLETHLKGLGDELTQQGAPIDLDKALARVRRFRALHPELHDVTLIAPDGSILLTAQNAPGTVATTLAGEPSFIRFLDEVKEGKALAVGQPMISVVDNTAIVPVRHAITDGAGRLLGVVSAALPHEYLRSFWKDTPITTDGVVGLMRDNGFLLSRYPVPAQSTVEQIYGQPRTGALIGYLRQYGFPQSGYMQGTSSVDGQAQLVVFRRLADYPVTLFVARPMSGVWAAWWDSVDASYAAVLLVLLGAAAAYLVGRQRERTWVLRHRRLQDAQQESNDRYRAIVETAMDGFALVDSTGRLVAVNDTHCRMNGYSREEMLALHVWDLDVVDSPAAFAARQTQIAAQGTARFESRQRRKDGSTFDVEVRAQARSGDGSSVCFVRDITERKAIEAELRRHHDQLERLVQERAAALASSEQRWQFALEGAQQGVWDWDMVAGTLYCSPQYRRMLGWGDEDFDTSAEGSLARFHPDDRARVGEVIAAHVRGDITHHAFSARLRCKDGHYLWVESRGKVVERLPDGTPKRMIGTHTDISERVAMEDEIRALNATLEQRIAARTAELGEALARLQLARDAAGIGIWAWDFETDRLEWDERLLDWYQVPSAERAAGVSSALWAARVHPEDRAGAEAAFAASLATPERPGEAHFRIVRPDGSVLHLHAAWVIERDAGGKPRRLTGINRDLTESRRKEEAQRKTTAELATILANATVGICMVRDRQIVWANERLAALFGYPHAELLGQCTRVFYADDASFEAVGAEDYPLLGQGTSSFRELELIRRDGSHLWVLLTGRAIDPADPGTGSIWVLEDITARRQAELNVMQLKEHYELLFEAAPDAYLIMELDGGRISGCNRAAETLLRGRREEIIGLTPDRLAPAVQPDGSPSTPESVTAVIGEVMRKGMLRFEWMHRRLDGEDFWADVTVRMMELTGRTVGFVIWRDITDQKEVEAANARLLQALDESTELVGIAGLDERTLYLNAGGRRMVGMDLGADVGQLGIADFVPAWAAERIAREALPLAANGGRWRGESALLAADGHEIPVIATIFGLRDRQGAVTSLATVQTDLTEFKAREAALRESRQRLDDILAGTRAGTWEWNVQTGEVLFNERWGEIVGYTPAELAPTSIETWTRLAHPDDLARSGKLLEAHLAGESPHYETETRMRHKDGHWVWVLDRGRVATWTKEGKPLLMSGTHLDITAMKQAEQLLVEARQAAESANRAKSSFLANMSHEIRTPLNAVLGLAGMLDGEVTPAERHDIARRIGDAGSLLMRTLNDILDFSKIEAGQLDIDLQPFELARLLDNVASLAGPRAQEKGMTLRVDATVVGDLALVGDAMRVEQILLNLVGNAVKFSAFGEVVLVVKLMTRDGPAIRLRFEVHDRGIGIPAATLATLFQPFVQAEAGTARRFGGSGLGLSICRHLVDLMGGTIGVDSEEGVGSSFWFELPFQEVTRKVQPPRAQRPPEAPAAVGGRLAGLHILAVDDSEMNRDLFRRILKREGAMVTLAADGSQAIVLLREGSTAFDAVLMDTQMPVLDGLAATRQIRTELGLADLPIITVTGGAYAEDRAQSRAAGANDFVVKPVGVGSLVTAILRSTTGRGHVAAAADHPANR